MLTAPTRRTFQAMLEVFADRRASIPIEYILLLGGFVLPMTIVPFWIMVRIAEHHKFVAKLLSLPVP